MRTVKSMTQLRPPFLLGFEELDAIMNRMSDAPQDGFPPYNIQKLPAGDKSETEPDRYRITVAVAGFAREDLDVHMENQELTIRGERAEESDTFLHKGIATRRFRRNFVLSEGIEVVSADLANGLLSIDLKREKPASNRRTIAIGSGA